MLEFYFQVRAFVGIYELLDENYLIYTQHTEEGRFRIKLLCVNPAVNLQKCLDQGRSCRVSVRHPLLPVRYYQSLISAREDDYAVYIPSPFDPARRYLAAGGDVSSRYSGGGKRSTGKSLPISTGRPEPGRAIIWCFFHPIR